MKYFRKGNIVQHIFDPTFIVKVLTRTDRYGNFRGKVMKVKGYTMDMEDEPLDDYLVRHFEFTTDPDFVHCNGGEGMDPMTRLFYELDKLERSHKDV